MPKASRFLIFVKQNTLRRVVARRVIGAFAIAIQIEIGE